MSDLMPRPVETAISLYRGRKQWDREDENKESENGVQVPIRGAWRAVISPASPLYVPPSMRMRTGGTSPLTLNQRASAL